MDIAMPRLDGLEATRRILAECPETRVLVLSAHEDAAYVIPLLEAGAIGYLPNTDFLDGQLELTDQGYVVTDDHGKTSVEGVWAAGDVSDWTYRQIATSVGAGCKAALQAEHYIAKLEDRVYPGQEDLE